MRYFITLNIESDFSYEEIISTIEQNNIKVLGVDAVTEYDYSMDKCKSLKNAINAMKKHKKKLNF